MNRDDPKKITAAFNDVLRHRVLNDMIAAIALELRNRAHLEMPPATGRHSSGDRLSIRMVYTGELPVRDQLEARRVLQRAGNPSEMIGMVDRLHKGSGK